MLALFTAGRIQKLRFARLKARMLLAECAGVIEHPWFKGRPLRHNQHHALHLAVYRHLGLNRCDLYQLQTQRRDHRDSRPSERLALQ